MDRKRLRLDRAEQLRRLVANNASSSAVNVSDIIAELQRQPEITNDLRRTRLNIGRALLQQVDSMTHIEVVPLDGGGEFRWSFLEPSTMLAASVRSNRCVAAAYIDALRASPPSLRTPWELVIGFDEFSPGNKLRVDNRRKCMALNNRQLTRPR